MKNILLAFTLMSIAAISANAQSYVQKDGLYYDNAGELYSGVVVEFYSEGLTRMTAHVVEGYLDGDVSFFNTDGSLQEKGSYDNGRKNGHWIQYNAAGGKTGEAFYVDGLKNGVWTVWDDNGVKRYHMVYNMGTKIDVWKMWDEESNLVSERVYSENK